MHKLLHLILVLSFSISGFSQKVNFVYLDPGDSTSNYYVEVQPSTRPFKGLLFLIPGMFERPVEVLKQTDLPRIAAQNGILTVIPTFKSGIASMGIDSATQSSLLEMLTRIIGAQPVKGVPFYIGGFSIGGTCSIKYAQLAFSNNYPIKPAAVFAIDAPLDFERVYNNFKRELSLAGTDKGLIAENTYMLDRMRNEFGGAPSSVPDSYHRHSPYSLRDSSHRAIRPLLHVPIRLYTEPDIDWWLALGVDYAGMNAFDLAAMANDLKRLGNKEVTFIATNGKGYRRPANTRHPHSWSIADPRELVTWLLSKK